MIQLSPSPHRRTALRAVNRPAAQLDVAQYRVGHPPHGKLLMLLLVLLGSTAAAQNPSDPARGVPGVTCVKGLLYPNASQSSEILSDYNHNFMSELALNSSIWYAENDAPDCNKSEYKCSAIGYQWCTHGKDCSCLADNDMGYLIKSIGAGNPAAEPDPADAMCDDPCWCTALLPQYLKARGMHNTSDACLKPKFSCDTATGTCAAANSTHPGNFSSHSSCTTDCHAPPPTPPPPPLAADPCIRFGHTIPVADKVTVEMVQVTPPAPRPFMPPCSLPKHSTTAQQTHTPDNICCIMLQEEDPTDIYTWTDYKYGQFSGGSPIA